MGSAQSAQKCEQADIEIFLPTIYKIKFVKTFIKPNKVIVRHELLGKYLKQEQERDALQGRRVATFCKEGRDIKSS